MSLAEAFIGVMALEELPADGKARVEREFTYYAKLVDEAQLEKADSREDQEQWSIRVAPSDKVTFAGELRVRRCEKPGEQPRFILTSKTFKVGDFGKVESETEVSEDMFLQFRKLSNSGMIKTRYCFNRADGLVWEVDVYKSPDGQRIDWVKIDLEVKDDREPPRDFPVDVTEVIGGDPRTRTEEERKQVSDILDNHFVLKNQYPRNSDNGRNAEGVSA